VEALRQSASFEPMRERLERFMEQRPQSARLPEAVHWLGWLRERAGEKADAAEAYWKAVEQYGERWECAAVEDLLLGIVRIQGGVSGIGSAERFENLGRAAESDGKRVMFVRCLWAQAKAVEHENAASAQVLLQRAGREADPALQHPRILLDAARAEREAGNLLLAMKRAWEICRWHPRTPERGAAEALCGDLAIETGEFEKAAQHFHRAERLLAHPGELAHVKLQRARLLADGSLGHAESQEAAQLLETVLADAASPARYKAEALLALGRLTRDAGERQKALAMFERVYVLYAGEKTVAAEAYLERATCLETLGKMAEAFEVYQALVEQEELREETPAVAAKERLAALRVQIEKGER
jgi:tetratricopeptide (TPR) repeat protein